MILNFSSKNSINSAISLSKELLEVINCLILEEVEAKVHSILKVNSIRIKLPLILIKVLYLEDRYNSNIDSPSKLSLFFINLSSEFNDKENLKLYLRRSEDKGLSKEYINNLLKKDYFIPRNNYELREVI